LSSHFGRCAAGVGGALFNGHQAPIKGFTKDQRSHPVYPARGYRLMEVAFLRNVCLSPEEPTHNGSGFATLAVLEIVPSTLFTPGCQTGTQARKPRQCNLFLAQ
jgi:hypothetical protein